MASPSFTRRRSLLARTAPTVHQLSWVEVVQRPKGTTRVRVTRTRTRSSIRRSCQHTTSSKNSRKRLKTDSTLRRQAYPSWTEISSSSLPREVSFRLSTFRPSIVKVRFRRLLRVLSIPVLSEIRSTESCCSHTILKAVSTGEKEPLVVLDFTKDWRFQTVRPFLARCRSEASAAVF